MPITITILPYGSPDYQSAVTLRRAVLRTPLGLDFSADDLVREAGDTHFGAWEGGAFIGAVVMTPYAQGQVKLRQMAVSPDHQGRNIGGQLLAAFEAHARDHAIGEIILAARVTAQGFYARHGYQVDGDVFSEVTIPHIRMWKAL